MGPRNLCFNKLYYPDSKMVPSDSLLLEFTPLCNPVQPWTRISLWWLKYFRSDDMSPTRLYFKTHCGFLWASLLIFLGSLALIKADARVLGHLCSFTERTTWWRTETPTNSQHQPVMWVKHLVSKSCNRSQALGCLQFWLIAHERLHAKITKSTVPKFLTHRNYKRYLFIIILNH